MGLKIFLVVCDLIIPIIMLLFGVKFSKQGPKEINMFYGYRTTRSMKNKETWEFAHQYCGILWKKIGVVMLILSAIVGLATLTVNNNIQGIVCGILVTIQTIVLVASIFPVEKALKEKFDDEGNRKA